MARFVASALVALAFLLLAAPSALAGSAAVVSATSATWDDVVAKEDLVLVEFFAPWCGHCKSLAPKYEAAAALLKGKVPLVSVDCTVESELCGQYGVRGYPTLKVFRNNVPTDYAGSRETDAIVRYLVKQKQPAVTTVVADSFEEFIESDKVVVVAFMAAGAPEFEEFEDVAETYRNDFTFGVVWDAPELAAAQGTKLPGIILYKKFDEGKNVFQGDFSEESIDDFVKGNSVPTMDDIGPDNYQAYAESNLPLAYLFVANDEQRQTHGSQVEEVAKKLKGKVNFVYIDAVKFGGHASNLNLKQEWPAFAIEVPKKKIKFPFDQSQAITAQAIEEFVQKFINNEIKPSLKSEEIPESQDGPVTVVVGKQFKEIVEQPKDVLIEFYAPWCGHCKKLAPIYDELGQKLKPFSDKIVIAKMDATANDLPIDSDIVVNGFPTIKLVKADNTIMDYQGDRSVDAFVEFLQRNAIHGKVIKLEQNASHGAHDDHDHDHEEL